MTWIHCVFSRRALRIGSINRLFGDQHSLLTGTGTYGQRLLRLGNQSPLSGVTPPESAPAMASPARFSRAPSHPASGHLGRVVDGAAQGGSSRLIEQPPLGRRPAWRPPRGFGGFGLTPFPIQVGEDLLDHHRVLDAGEDSHCPAAGRAGRDIDAKDPLETFAQVIAARRSAGVAASGSRFVGCWPPLPRLAGVTRPRCLLLGAKAPWNRVRFTRGFGTSAARRAMKSSGSKMTCVVPSRYGVFS